MGQRTAPTARRRAAEASTPPLACRVRPAASRESRTLLDWLDRGLREGRPGRLAAEYPVALGPGSHAIHLSLERGGQPLSHALVSSVPVEAQGRRLELGMIGLVYTDPAWRGRGLAGRVVEDACAWLQRAGAAAVALWSDRWDFYRRLGFEPAGREWQLRITPETLRRARGHLDWQHSCGTRPGQRPLAVGPPDERDWARLEALYASQPVHVARPAGELRRHATGPDLRFRVARHRDCPVAYAVSGKGDDWPDVVHEWAGDPEGVLACLAALCEERGSQGLLAGPARDERVDLLRGAGAPARAGVFGLVRVLSAERLWRALRPESASLARVALRDDTSPAHAAQRPPRTDSADDRRRLPRTDSAGARRRFRLTGSAGEARLDQAALLEILLGERRQEVDSALSADEARAWRVHFPWPLFVWGFDAI